MSSIIDKVRKLRALATSENANEAAAAAAAADRLIQEHSISEAELGEPTIAPIFGDAIVHWPSNVPYWAHSLGTFIASHYGCYVWAHRTYTNGVYLRISGRPDDIETARYMYAWLTAQIARLTARNCKGKGKSYASAYRMGCVSAIRSSMSAAKTAERQNATSSALAVVDARHDSARALAKAANPDIRSKAKRTPMNVDGYYSSQADGANIRSATALPAAAGRLLGA
jgi:Protein of unknown function (DUF2786)